MKLWTRSRTLWWNALALVAAVLALPEVVAVLPATWLPTIGAVIAVGNILLRLNTSEGLRARAAAEPEEG
jgi:hypothetical protein